MFLKDLTGKEILSGKTCKGYCRGVGVSLKTHTVKYLLCASTQNGEADFALSTTAIAEIGEQIRMSTLRPLLPRNCVRIFIGRPIYAFDGIYLGQVEDLVMEGFVATQLLSSKKILYPVNAITACFDAVILKKEQPYPLGQRIPAPLLPLVTDKNSSVVTKPILRTAIQKSSLIKLTLSLPPFTLNGDFVLR